jgi:hypothetical protein
LLFFFVLREELPPTEIAEFRFPPVEPVCLPVGAQTQGPHPTLAYEGVTTSDKAGVHLSEKIDFLTILPPAAAIAESLI